MPFGVTLGISIALWVLIALSGFFSATETAFTSFSKARMKSLAKDKKSARLVLKMNENFNGVLTTLLIANNLINIVATSLAAVLFTAHFGDIGVTLSTGVMTVLVLIFGEVSPKTLAKERPEEVAMFACGAVYLLTAAAKPVCYLFDKWRKILIKIFRLKRRRPSMTAEEFGIIVSDITDEGILPQSEQVLIKNAMRFEDIEVAAVMTGLGRIAYIDVSDSVSEIRELFEAYNYSRVPVVDGGLYKVIGILYRADFYENLLDGGTDITRILKPAFRCSPTQKLPKLLEDMRLSRQHIAIVTDGARVVGLITVEDVIRVLIGDIQDRYDAVPR